MKSATFDGYMAEINGKLRHHSFALARDDVTIWLRHHLTTDEIMAGVAVRIVHVSATAVELPGK